MKTRPVSQRDQPDYPDRRSFLKGVAGGVAALAFAAARPGTGGETKKTKTTEEVIAALAAQLGAADFRQRKAATSALIKLGKGDGKDKAADKNVRKQVLAAMKPLAQSRDPEVAARAKQVITTLTVVVAPPPERNPQVDGGLVIEID